MCLPAAAMAQSNFLVNEKNKTIARADSVVYPVTWEEGNTYEVFALQKGMDLEVLVRNNKQELLKAFDSPNGTNGPERFDFKAPATGQFTITLKAFDDPSNPKEAAYDFSVRAVSKEELAAKEAEENRRALLVANAKTIETADLDRFYLLFDKLKQATTRQDSLDLVKKLYFDQASGGFAEALFRLKFTPERYVDVLATHPKFFESMRANILKAKQSVPLVEALPLAPMCCAPPPLPAKRGC